MLFRSQAVSAEPVLAVPAELVPTLVLLLAERATDVPWAMIASAEPETAVLVSHAFADMAVATLVEPPTAVTLVPAALHLAVLEPVTAVLLLAVLATAALETDAAPRPTRTLATSLS